MSKNACGSPSKARIVVFCALVLVAAPVVRGQGDDASKGQSEPSVAKSDRPRVMPVRIVNETRSPVPVIDVSPFEIVGPTMAPPKQTIVSSVNLAVDDPSGSPAASLPAVQDWLIMEVEVLPLPPSDPQKTPAKACIASVQVPVQEVHPASNLPSFLTTSWSGLDFRSFHRQLPIALRRQAGETVDLQLEAFLGDGSCRATLILRGVALPAV